MGFINTLAGGGTIISLSLLMFLGLPAPVANGTNRIAVIFQNIVAVRNFQKSGMLDAKKGLLLSLPVVLGSIAGARIAVTLNEQIIEKAIAVIMIIMLIFILAKPQSWLKGNEILLHKKIAWYTYLIFFFIGIYGGFIHAGVGYFILASLVLGCGYNLVKANAIKNLIVLAYVPFTLLVFVLQKQVYWEYGLIHAIGNIIGAYVASKFAIKWGAQFIRWVIVAVILFSVSDLLGFIDIQSTIQHMINFSS